MRTIFTNSLRFFLLTVVSFFFFHVAYAQQNAGITLVPATIEEPADPGTVLSRTLTVTNVSDVDKDFFVYKKNIKGVESGGVPVFAEEGAEKTGYEMSEWVQIPIESIHVPAFSSAEVPIVISIPSSATPGSHFGGVFVSVEPPKLRATGAGVGYEVATIISIRISGDINDTARIRSFSTDKLLYSTKNVNFFAKIENQGNILIRPYGPVTITNMFGAKPESFTVNTTYAGVFPGTMRDFEFSWDSEGIGFGRYEAVIGLAYDGEDGQKTIDASLIFWIFPLKILSLIFFSLVTLIALGYFLTKYYINQAIIRASGGRRITPQRYRKQVGISRLAFVFISLMVVLVLFLLVVLVFFA